VCWRWLRLVHAAADTFLLHHGVDPEQRYMRLFIEGVARATNHHVVEISVLCLVYALVRFGESYGLWLAKHWAEWLAVISVGLYMPLELYHFARGPSFFTAGVILFNFIIFIYLAHLLRQQRAQRRAIQHNPE
jgi:uncharacterized membrane protein (DUF2068 family)